LRLIEVGDAEPECGGTVPIPPKSPRGHDEAVPKQRRSQSRSSMPPLLQRPVVRLTRRVEPEKETLDALQALAQDTSYLAGQATQVRCRFVSNASTYIHQQEHAPDRRVHSGRPRKLEDGSRPGAGPRALPQSVFSDQWIVFEGNAGQSPDLLTIAIVTRRFREALMSWYGKARLAVPALISGHYPDGTPVSYPHMAVVPLADVGSPCSEGRLLGIAIVFPRETDGERQNMEHDSPDDPSGRTIRWRTFDRLLNAVTELELGKLGVWSIRRVPVADTKLQLRRYTQPARRWASVTPIVRDKFPKAKNPVERHAKIVAIVASACQNIGLPVPRAVSVYRHAAIKGVPSAHPWGKAPERTGWALPGFLSRRVLTHAIIEFSEPVRGPVIVGAGRYAGLGLCIGAQT